MSRPNTRTVIVAFHRQEPAYEDNYKVLMGLFRRHSEAWLQHVDQLIVIDSGCSFKGWELPCGGTGKVSVVRRPPDSHWGNLNQVVRQVDGGKICLIDSDMLIYTPSVINVIFNSLELHDAIGILDTSGGHDLSKYPLMAENVNRSARQRLCPYLCAFWREGLRADFDFTATSGVNHYDSMGLITHQMLEDGLDIVELQDDRSSIYLEDDNRITSTQWLDSPPKLWAIVENPPLGYYHIRNFSGGLNLANSYWVDRPMFETLVRITPRREALRLLSWVAIACQKTGLDTSFMNPAIDAIVSKGQQLEGMGSLERSGRISALWGEYLDHVRLYYPWMEQV